ncbi:uncharacterized protein PAC_01591 [Phialocephala subalpina]|uniref:Uncharacterized protein n=1 Tax=Phialocephala subalpina TaxID=576137 RepID=A0A1L7WG15_9HELO|nr:uncharacterized protein PAC_01591 [Phialocephala subalpina]
MSSQDVAFLRSQLEQAETLLKTTRKTAEENHQRLTKELAASDAQDSKTLIECENTVSTIKKLIETEVRSSRPLGLLLQYLIDNQKLRESRAENLSADEKIDRFEKGNMDYVLFRERDNISALRNCYEECSKVAPTAVEVSHIAALICAGWIKAPEETEYWKERGEQKVSPGSPPYAPGEVRFNPSCSPVSRGRTFRDRSPGFDGTLRHRRDGRSLVVPSSPQYLGRRAPRRTGGESPKKFSPTSPQFNPLAPAYGYGPTSPVPDFSVSPSVRIPDKVPDFSFTSPTLNPTPTYPPGLDLYSRVPGWGTSAASTGPTMFTPQSFTNAGTSSGPIANGWGGRQRASNVRTTYRRCMAPSNSPPILPPLGTPTSQYLWICTTTWSF